MRTKKAHPLLYCLLGSLLATAVLLCCVWLMHSFGIPSVGRVEYHCPVGLFSICLASAIWRAILRLLLPDKLKVLAVQAAVVVMAMLLFSGYTFPALGMPPLFQAIARAIPFTYFAIPFAGCDAFRQLDSAGNRRYPLALSLCGFHSHSGDTAMAYLPAEATRPEKSCETACRAYAAARTGGAAGMLKQWLKQDHLALQMLVLASGAALPVLLAVGQSLCRAHSLRCGGFG